MAVATLALLPLLKSVLLYATTTTTTAAAVNNSGGDIRGCGKTLPYKGGGRE